MLIFRNLTPETEQQINWRQQEITALLPDPGYAAAVIAAGGTVFVILDGENVIGAVSLSAETTATRPVCGIVEQLAVLPQFRRQHLGRMLMGLAANAAADRSVWFLTGSIPETEEARAFAASVGMKQTEWLPDMPVLDLSDVDGLRYG